MPAPSKWRGGSNPGSWRPGPTTSRCCSPKTSHLCEARLTARSPMWEHRCKRLHRSRRRRRRRGRASAWGSHNASGSVSAVRHRRLNRGGTLMRGRTGTLGSTGNRLLVRWSRLFAAITALMLVLTACGGAGGGDTTAATTADTTADEEPSGDPIKIGGTLGLTGIYSGPSAGYEIAYRYWADQVNANGGLLGRPVELIIYDYDSTPQGAHQLHPRLINGAQIH